MVIPFLTVLSCHAGIHPSPGPVWAAALGPHRSPLGPPLSSHRAIPGSWAFLSHVSTAVSCKPGILCKDPAHMPRCSTEGSSVPMPGKAPWDSGNCCFPLTGEGTRVLCPWTLTLEVL